MKEKEIDSFGGFALFSTWNLFFKIIFISDRLSFLSYHFQTFKYHRMYMI